ncbi:MAG: AAA family ATPase [Planctomycetota bacterium]
MRSIAVINQKGGVGKTTTAVNLAAAFARLGRHVLLLDLDPQSHATLHVGVEVGPDQPSVYDVLIRGVAIGDAARSLGKRLVVIPSHVDLVGAELELADRHGRETVLARALEPYQDGFDICLIDCGPSLGLLTINALAAAQEIIIPLQPHFLALQGLGRLVETITLVRAALNPGLRVLGVVLCMYETATRLAQEVAADVRQFVAGAAPDTPWHGARVFDATIRRNIKLAECPSFGKTIFQYAPTSHGAEDYLALAREVLAAATARAPSPQLDQAGAAAPDAVAAQVTTAAGAAAAGAAHAAEPRA